MAVQTGTWRCEVDRSRDLTTSLPLSSGLVGGEVLDAITAEIVQARGPAGRAVIIFELIDEICATVEWLHDTRPELDDVEADELTAVSRLSRTARDHRRQLSSAPEAANRHATSRSTP